MGCRRTAPARELTRLVRTPEGSLAVGRTLPGRGAWLCATSPSCFDAATRRKAFGRALRAPVDERALSAARIQLYGTTAPER
ncbi:MAG: YlxR family protein [Actinobacteria bacterium]|nr:YlxR family protein [Actinomycetota bacterium]